MAENISAALHGESPKTFRFRTLGTLVALGHRTGVAQIKGWKFSGLLAWLMWRTIYLSKLPGLEKKVRVALDWGIDLFFPRDIVLTMSVPTPTLEQMTRRPRARAAVGTTDGWPGQGAGRMNRSDVFRMALLPGALAGLVGGLVFAAAMTQLGVLPTIAMSVRTNSTVISVIVHVITASLIGAGFGALVWRQQTGSGETLFWGLVYGMFWWFLGPLTLMPLLREGTLAWDVHTAQMLFPSLVGHILYGAVIGLAFVFLRPKAGLKRVSPGASSCGVHWRDCFPPCCWGRCSILKTSFWPWR